MADEGLAAGSIGIISKPIYVKLAQTVGLTAAGFFAGQYASSTFTLLPNIMQGPPPQLARQLRETDQQAAKVRAPATVVLSALFAWLASREPAITTRAFKAYAVAAALVPAVLPYSYILIRPLHLALADREASFASAGVVSTSTPSLQTSSSTVLVDAASSSAAPSNADQSESNATASVYQTTSREGFREFVHAMSPSGPQNGEMTVHQLADKWGWLNLGRALIGTAAALAGTWAVVDEDLSFFELF